MLKTGKTIPDEATTNAIDMMQYAAILYAAGCMYHGTLPQDKHIAYQRLVRLITEGYYPAEEKLVAFLYADENTRKLIDILLDEIYCYFLVNNRDAAIAFYEHLAKEGCQDSMFRLGEINANVLDRVDVAITWYERAQKEGHPLAELRLDTLRNQNIQLQEGGKLLQKRQYVAAFEYYYNLAKKGNQKALENLAYMFSNGLGMRAYDNEILRLFIKNGCEGSFQIQAILGMMFEKGVCGVQQNNELAFYWTLMAARNNRLSPTAIAQGSSPAHAQCAVGKMYLQGKGIPQNKEAAAMWFKQAEANGMTIKQVWAEQSSDKCPRLSPRFLCMTTREWREEANSGNAKAQFVMGMSFLNGTEGIGIDKTKALYWLKKAATQGDLRAGIALAKINEDSADSPTIYVSEPPLSEKEATSYVSIGDFVSSYKEEIFYEKPKRTIPERKASASGLSQFGSLSASRTASPAAGAGAGAGAPESRSPFSNSR